MLRINLNTSIFQFLLLFTILTLLYGCRSSFIVEQATHKKIVVNESSNSDIIKVTVNQVEEGIEFQKIIYNRVQSDVTVTDLGNGSFEIATVLQHGGPMIMNKEQTEVDKSNRLIYTKDGKEEFYQLDDIEFLPTTIKRGSSFR